MRSGEPGARALLKAVVSSHLLGTMEGHMKNRLHITVALLAAAAQSGCHAASVGPEEREGALPGEAASVVESDGLSASAAAGREPAAAALQAPDVDEGASLAPGPRGRMTRAERVASHGRWVKELLGASPARVSLAGGAPSWRHERSKASPTGAWLTARVMAERACGAPLEVTVRVPFHSELPSLSPAEGGRVLLFGSFEEGVLTASWASRWDGEVVPVRDLEVPLSSGDVFGGCERGEMR